LHAAAKRKKPKKRKKRVAAPAQLSARLVAHVTLDARADGSVAVGVGGQSVGLGKFSAAAAERAQELGTGLPLRSFASGTRATDKETDKEIEHLVRRLAGHGLLEYRLGRADDADQVVIEPQLPDYRPQMPKLGEADVLALSRFAYLRRRGNDLVLESPRAGALFKIGDPKVAVALAMLSTARPIKWLRRQEGFPGLELLALLVDSRILFKVDPARADRPRSSEGDDALVLWDFHDLLFHARSTQGRHANPIGAVYPHVGAMPLPPAVRPPWPGEPIDLHTITQSEASSPAARLLRARHSARVFDEQRPITLAELARFLDVTARVQAKFKSQLDLGDDSPEVEFAPRPYPSGGGSWGLELYLAVDQCDGLARGFYHYDADRHALVPIDARADQLDALLSGAAFAMAAPAVPQILITIAARFGRISWKYSSLAYSLILKEVGVLLQTLYLVATDMGLGGCAIGSTDIDLFARMTGLELHAEGAVGQFALGRSAEQTPTA
jgi:SagB-type dehydrogenase family enzyme